MLTKKQRRKWWQNLTPEQKNDYIKRKNREKAEFRQLHPKESFISPTISDKDGSKALWLKKIRAKNPWLTI